MQAPCENPMIPSKGPFFCMKSYTYDTVSSKSTISNRSDKRWSLVPPTQVVLATGETALMTAA